MNQCYIFIGVWFVASYHWATLCNSHRNFSGTLPWWLNCLWTIFLKPSLSHILNYLLFFIFKFCWFSGNYCRNIFIHRYDSRNSKRWLIENSKLFSSIHPSDLTKSRVIWATSKFATRVCRNVNKTVRSKNNFPTNIRIKKYVNKKLK